MIRVMDSPGELSHCLYCGPSQIYIDQTYEIIFGNGLSQLLLSMSNCLLANITLLWMLILTLSLVKMTIIIGMSVRRTCVICLSPFLTAARTTFTSSTWFICGIGLLVCCFVFWFFFLLVWHDLSSVCVHFDPVVR